MITVKHIFTIINFERYNKLFMLYNSIILRSLIWKFLERAGTRLIQVIVQVILARLLMPKDFGLVAIMMVFINLANVFVQSGFNTALIQNKHVTDIDYSSIFYLSLAFSGILYILLFTFAPLIAVFYKMRNLVAVLRVLAIILFFGAINSIQNAVIARNFMFKQLFFSSLGAIIGSGIIGILLAYSGYGVWALVWQQISNQMFICVIMWFTVMWRPKLLFSLNRVRSLLSFGWKLLLSTLLNTLYLEMRTLVIGKEFSPQELGYYNRGGLFPMVVVSNIDGSLQSVMLPAYSNEQDDPSRVKCLVRKTITMSTFLTFPCLAGLIAMADPLVRLLLTEKWLPCVPFLRIACLSYALVPIHTANLDSINAMGHSEIFLRLEIIKKIVGVTFIAIAVFYFKTAIAVAWSGVIFALFNSFINASPNKRLLKYGYIEQINDLMPSLYISIVMGFIVYIISYIHLNLYIQLILQILSGVVIYCYIAYLFKFKAFNYLLTILHNKKRQKFNNGDCFSCKK